jgi:hypothetical protein
MTNPHAALVAVSQAYFDSMKGLAETRDWLSDIYGTGPGSKTIEVALTKTVLANLGGVAEISKAVGVPSIGSPEALDTAFESYATLRGERARVDGYFPQLNCFWEAKVSKVDRTTKPGAKAIYDIGQWAQDLVKLTEIGKHLPEAGLIYSIAAITKNAVPDPANAQTWLEIFQQRLQERLYSDLVREEPELLEDHENRRRQLRLLIGLVGLDARHFHVIPADKWAIISFQVTPLLEQSRVGSRA